jgi:HEAT repeat protein
VYPFIVASEDATLSEGGPLDNVVANLGHLLMQSGASSNTRIEAVRALSSVKTEAASSALRAAAQDQNTSLRLEAAAALLRRNDISPLDMVVELLLQPSQNIDQSARGDVVFALDTIKDPLAIPALSRLLSEGDVEVRRRASAALRHSGSKQAIGALAKALDDTDQAVRYNAVTGLAEITQETNGMPSIEAFKKNETPYLTHWHGRVSKLTLPQQR